MWPAVKWVASRYGKAPGIYDDAMDGAIHAVRSYTPDRGKLSSWVVRNASLYVTRRTRRNRSPELVAKPAWYRDVGYRRVELRDEVEHHMSRATPRQRSAMLAFMSGKPSHTDRAAIQSYRRTLHGTHPTRRRRAGQ